ncbi:MAG: VC0807 family protein, partial [Burkholderiaceae bacterium]
MVEGVRENDASTSSTNSGNTARNATPPQSNTSLLANLVVNIAIPSLILMKLSAPERLGPALALVVALCFPLGYGLWEVVKAGRPSFIAILGLANVLLTGGLGLMQVEGFWFAFKEAAVPFILGAGVLVSLKTQTPLVRSLLLNERVVNVPLVQERLESSGQGQAFEKLVASSTVFLACSFFFECGPELWPCSGDPRKP